VSEELELKLVDSEIDLSIVGRKNSSFLDSMVKLESVDGSRSNAVEYFLLPKIL
jgi:hypothetical protein